MKLPEVQSLEIFIQPSDRRKFLPEIPLHTDHTEMVGEARKVAGGG